MQRYIWPAIWGFAVAFAVGFGLSMLEKAAGESIGMLKWWAPLFLGGFTFYIMGNLAGNKSVRNASSAERNAALSAAPPPGQGLLVVFHEGFVGKAAGLNIVVDGKARAQLKSPRFVIIPLDPGRHEVSAAFGGLAGAQNNAGLAVVSIQEGKVAAVRASLSMGALKNTINLEEEADIEAVRARLRNMKMVSPDPV